MTINSLGAQSTAVNESGGSTRIGLRASLRYAWPQVWPLLAVALLLRLFFLLVGAEFYYAGRQVDIHINGDSYSYIFSLHNLLNYGRYTFDFAEPDAAVGRLPGYPFFYGLHYLIFGYKQVLLAVSVTQVVLDTLGIWLIFVITAKLAPPTSWAPLLAALVLTFYPFSVVWVPIIGTETLGLFLVLLWWATLLVGRPTTLNWVLLGMLVAIIVYVREFLGVCLAVTLFYLLVISRRTPARFGRLRPAGFVLAGFLSLYIWWPVRNYITLGRFIPLKPVAAGYANLREDTQAALAWMLTWTNDVTMAFDTILLAPKPSFPEYVISTAAEKQLLDSLVVLSRSCASSFHTHIQPYKPSFKPGSGGSGPQLYGGALRHAALRYNNCNSQVSAGFHRLRASYIQRHPVRARLEVPLQNFQKIIFKNQFKAIAGKPLTVAQRVSAVLFTWRSILLVLGLAGAWRYRRLPGLWPAVLFTAIIFGYMAVIFRSLEMRYLLQADIVMLVPAALLLASWLPRRWSRPASAVTEAVPAELAIEQ
ncbi:glycosyltransferase family protein [Hymenobacter elongatus]|uniref:Glycosyltransferase RgtA/B/C/D-like domain-containing protein n=1 Tax=Hymenobacter elongatus TaxID=877208 RepID=A0A4Z0PK92_9BACT|nr:hypothetical protein [Hymenobacter elongatus]TGE15562.1 hypothetical protein E5J99_12225 [Hymenobacter elongatus]